jgi:hypothetical protein
MAAVGIVVPFFGIIAVGGLCFNDHKAQEDKCKAATNKRASHAVVHCALLHPTAMLLPYWTVRSASG